MTCFSQSEIIVAIRRRIVCSGVGAWSAAEQQSATAADDFRFKGFVDYRLDEW